MEYPFYRHASRYMELYLPTGTIEIAHTQRYSHRTGKSELCILATRPLAPGNVLSELKGSMADLTEADELELKRTDRRNSHGGIRRDFSVIHSKQLKKNHLFLGPARFVNVSLGLMFSLPYPYFPNSYTCFTHAVPCHPTPPFLLILTFLIDSTTATTIASFSVRAATLLFESLNQLRLARK